MSSGHELARIIPQLAQIRASAGDTNALTEYAAWLKSANAEKVETYALDAFALLWKYAKRCRTDQHRQNGCSTMQPRRGANYHDACPLRRPS